MTRSVQPRQRVAWWPAVSGCSSAGGNRARLRHQSTPPAFDESLSHPAHHPLGGVKGRLSETLAATDGIALAAQPARSATNRESDSPRLSYIFEIGETKAIRDQ